MPVPDFALSRLGDGPVRLPAGAPRIVVCVAGTADVDGHEVPAGHAVYVVASAAPLVRGGSVFVASTG